MNARVLAAAATASGRPLPWGFLGMLGLALAIELSLSRHAMELTHSDNWDWADSRAAARQLAPRCDILFLGDSLAKCALLPRIVEQHTGRPSYNLAVFAGEAPSSYFLLRQAIESGARPSAIVVDFKQTILSLRPQAFVERWPFLLTVRDAIDLSWTLRDGKFLAAVMLAKLLPSVRNRFQIRTTIRFALEGKDTFCWPILLTTRRNHRFNQGAQPQAKQPEYRAKAQANFNDPVLFPAVWSCRRVHATYLRRFLDLAAGHHIRVFWVLPPVAPEAQARYEETGLHQAFTHFVQAVQAQYTNLVVVDGRKADYSGSAFLDPTHLDRDGATTLSHDVGQLVAADLNGTAERTAWLTLPRFRKHERDPRVEDFTESLLALSQAAGRRR